MPSPKKELDEKRKLVIEKQFYSVSLTEIINKPKAEDYEKRSTVPDKIYKYNRVAVF